MRMRRSLPWTWTAVVAWSACGGTPSAAVRPPDSAPDPADGPSACERQLRCNAPECSCPEGYRCVLPGDGEPADCARDDDAAGHAWPCDVCDRQLAECRAHDGTTCDADEARCRELCQALQRHHDARPGGPCPCAPGLCCQHEHCVANGLVYFSPYELLDAPVPPEAADVVLRGVFLRCAIEEPAAAPTAP